MFQTLFYEPLYNGLVFILATLPWLDAGFAVVFVTLVVKFILFPFSQKAVRTQLAMKRLEPKLAKIREMYAGNKEEQARQVMAFYKDNKVNPFSSLLLVLVQLPIIFALYKVFITSGLPNIDTSLLYSFVPKPEHINVNFLNLSFLDITQKSYILAFLAGITSYFQIKLSTSGVPKPNPNTKSFTSDLAQTMQKQMKYVFPVMVFFIAHQISGAVALYWFTSNMFMIFQELAAKKTMVLESAEVVSTTQTQK